MGESLLRVRIAILMSTYNGEKWVQQQLDSILKQTGVDSCIYIRDDGSADNTLSIIGSYRESNRVFITGDDRRKRLGAGDSFMELVKYAQSTLADQYDYFAFADQDDYWQPDKLISAVELMQGMEEPCHYFSKQTIVDAKLRLMNEEDYIPYSNQVLHSIGQCNAFGCTFVFNRRLLGCIQRKTVGRGYHDAWIFRLSVWCGFRIFYDTNSHILYRQHGQNAAGPVRKKIWYRQLLFLSTWRNQIDRFFCKNLNDVVLMQRDIYEKYADAFPNDNMELLKLVVGYRYNIRDRYHLMKHPVFKTNGNRDYVRWMFRIAMNRM